MRYNVVSVVMWCFLFFQTASALHLGSHFIFSLPETRDKEVLKSWLKKTRPGGVMLLASHFTNKPELKDFITFLRHETKNLGMSHLLITVDWEGGIVSRPNKVGGFSSVPSPWSLAQAGRSACFLGGMLIGHQLREYDIDVTFAPSLDLYDPANYILATRCFDADPKKTAECAIAFCKGLESRGVMPVIKHFPGLGVGKKDTHLSAVRLGLSEHGLHYHMQPFLDALEAGVPMVMCTHAQHDFFGSDPITLESRAVKFLKEKNKKAFVITDDFSMKGVHVKSTVAEAALQALCAGYDMIIFSGKPDEQVAMLEELHDSAGDLTTQQKAKLIAHEKVVTQRKNEFRSSSVRKRVLPIDSKRLSYFLAKRCFQVPEHERTLYDASKVMMVTANVVAIRPPEKWFIENGKSYLAGALEKKGKKVTEYLLNPKNSETIDDVHELCKELGNKDVLIVQTFFYADNVWNDVQRSWLELLEPYQDKIIVISLGHPFEQTILPKATVLNLGSFGDMMLEDVAYYLCNEPTLTGADQLAINPKMYIQDKRIGLLCHKCSVVCSNGEQIFLPDFIKDNTVGAELVALFSPEHGLLGSRPDAVHVDSASESEWGCPIYSLHGKYRKPTSDMLAGLDLIIVDFQEVGMRCYTYLSTLYYMLESAQENNIPVLVLDRPNPLIMWGRDGDMLDSKHASFLGKIPTTLLHGSSVGVIAQNINKKIGADLTVLACGKQSEINKQSKTVRAQPYPHYFYHKEFIPPSPNLSSIDAVFVYPMTVLIEGTNYSEGRGTSCPFQQVGAPWVNKYQLAQELNKMHLPGIYFEPVTFVPVSIQGVSEAPKHKSMKCEGVFVHVYSMSDVKPMQTAELIITTLFNLYPKESKLICFSNKYTLDMLSGNDALRTKLTASSTVSMRA